MYPIVGWRNRKSADTRNCACGTWKQHWLNYSGRGWPTSCSVMRCNNPPTVGAPVINSNVAGESIVPMCAACNKLADEFILKINAIAVSANPAETCAAKKKVYGSGWE
jgi:hypothetical protein